MKVEDAVWRKRLCRLKGSNSIRKHHTFLYECVVVEERRRGEMGRWERERWGGRSEGEWWRKGKRKRNGRRKSNTLTCICALGSYSVWLGEYNNRKICHTSRLFVTESTLDVMHKH